MREKIIFDVCARHFGFLSGVSHCPWLRRVAGLGVSQPQRRRRPIGEHITSAMRNIMT